MRFATPAIAAAAMAALVGREALAVPADALSLDAALARALVASPELRVATAEVEAAHGRDQQASLYVANPVITAEVARHTAPGDEEQVDRMFSVAQEIEIGGQRALRVAATRWDVERAELLLADPRRRVLGEVRRAFAGAVAAERRVRVAAESEELARRLATATTARERAGDATGLDVELAAIESARAAQATSSAATDRKRALDRLALAIGAADSDPLAVADPGEPSSIAPPASDEALVEHALATRPDLAAARAERARLEGEAAFVKRRGEVPNPVVRGYYRKELLDETIVGGEIAIPIPIWNREQGTETALRATASAAGAEIDRLARQIPREVRLSLARRAAAAVAWRRFRDQVLPATAAAEKLIERSYAQGYAGLTEALAQRDRLLQARSAAIAAWLDLEEAGADLIEAVGGDPS